MNPDIYDASLAAVLVTTILAWALVEVRHQVIQRRQRRLRRFRQSHYTAIGFRHNGRFIR